MTDKMTLLAHVFEPANADPSIDPADDFYGYVHGTWLRDTKIAPDRGMESVFSGLHDQAEEQVKQIIIDCQDQKIPGKLAKLVGQVYHSFLDTQAIEAQGLTPLQPYFAAIDQAKDHRALTEYLAKVDTSGIGNWFEVTVDADMNQPDTYALYLYQSGLGLPDESYYQDEEHAQLRASYVTHIANMLKLAEVCPPEQATQCATSIVEWETKLAACHWNRVRTREADQTNNPMCFACMVALAPDFAWQSWAENAGGPWAQMAADLADGGGCTCQNQGPYQPSNEPEKTPDASEAGSQMDAVGQEIVPSLIVMMPDFMKNAATLWKNTDIQQLKLWAKWRTLRAFARFLPAALDEENFDFYGRCLTGTPQQRARWKRAVGLVEGLLGEAVGEIYVSRHFPPAYKERMEELVADLIAAYQESISTLEWMSPATRERALEKLASFTPKIGYPDKWRDYSQLELPETGLIAQIVAGNKFEAAYAYGKLKKPVDRGEWFMTPQTINAYYNPTMNEIVFPAAILQPPFFNPAADDAVNYGAIGAVIGHEIGHGFDDQGSKFDGSGAMVDWWTPEDRAEFSRRAGALIDQYDGLNPRQLGPEDKVNGALTVGENLGDLGGATIALKALRIAMRRQGISQISEAPEIDGLNALQRFFLSYARVWRSKCRDEELRRRLTIDPHSPGEFRCNTVLSNLDEFHDTYQVKPGNGMYLDPGSRVRIW